MSENCRTECPVYLECKSRIDNLARAQRSLRDEGSSMDAPFQPYGDTEIDIFQSAAEGHAEISQATTECNGPRMSPAGYLIYALSHSITYRVAPYINTEALNKAIETRFASCSNRSAKASLVKVPLLSQLVSTKSSQSNT